MNTMELCNQRKQSEAAGRVLLRSILTLYDCQACHSCCHCCDEICLPGNYIPVLQINSIRVPDSTSFGVEADCSCMCCQCMCMCGTAKLLSMSRRSELRFQVPRPSLSESEASIHGGTSPSQTSLPVWL